MRENTIRRDRNPGLPMQIGMPLGFGALTVDLFTNRWDYLIQHPVGLYTIAATCVAYGGWKLCEERGALEALRVTSNHAATTVAQGCAIGGMVLSKARTCYEGLKPKADADIVRADAARRSRLPH